MVICFSRVVSWIAVFAIFHVGCQLDRGVCDFSEWCVCDFQIILGKKKYGNSIETDECRINPTPTNPTRTTGKKKINGRENMSLAYLFYHYSGNRRTRQLALDGEGN